jgi:hypothetical protein
MPDQEGGAGAGSMVPGYVQGGTRPPPVQPEM